MKKPSPAELHLLETLSRLGPSTVRDLHNELEGEVVYTTVLKQLQVLLGKGLVQRDASGRSHIYTVAVEPKAARRGMLQDFVAKVFAGSTRDLILGALGSDEITDEQREQIARILSEGEE